MPEKLQDLDLPELGRLFFAREESVSVVGEEYPSGEILDLISDRASDILTALGQMSSDQLAYRLPGTPQGWDASGDEAEFNTSEIVTHLVTGTTFYRFSIARALGHPRPPFVRPPREVQVTGRQGSVLGRGGWSGMTAVELATLLRETTDDFLAYIATLNVDEERALGTYEEYGELTIKGWLLLLALHYDMHLKQIELMRKQPDFPLR
jgi:hypothetical protein